MAGRWLFDVDGTLIDSLTGTSLRPGAVELLERIRGAGGRVTVWSAGGDAYSRACAEAHGIDQLVDDFHAKEARDVHGRYLPPAGMSLVDTVFVDDRPEDMPVGATVHTVFPYLADNPHDRALLTLGEQVVLPS
ncbi:MAG: HAD family hydrolase [Actinomycetota bacterium]|nr:HAD family hydrolase [Actinomycetota bacterium]